jgi:two-component system chemotaxis response regulator CheY
LAKIEGGVYTDRMPRGPILIVDDSMVARLSLKSSLKESGAELVEACSGEAALDLVDKGLEPSLVFMDLTMPGMGGLEALKLLRSRKPEIKVVVVTADIQSYSLAEVRVAGAFGIVRKPAVKGDIVALVANAWGEAAQA